MKANTAPVAIPNTQAAHNSVLVNRFGASGLLAEGSLKVLTSPEESRNA
jgi:hypothetical protein